MSVKSSAKKLLVTLTAVGMLSGLSACGLGGTIRGRLPARPIPIR